MRKIKVVDLPTDVSPLTNIQLDQLKEWAEHPGFKILNAIGNKKIVDMAVEAVSREVLSVEETRATLTDIAQFKKAFAYIMDVGNRSKEEIDRRSKKTE